MSNNQEDLRSARQMAQSFLATAESELQRIEARLGPDHRAVARLRDTIKDARIVLAIFDDRARDAESVAANLYAATANARHAAEDAGRAS